MNDVAGRSVTLICVDHRNTCSLMTAPTLSVDAPEISFKNDAALISASGHFQVRMIKFGTGAFVFAQRATVEET